MDEESTPGAVASRELVDVVDEFDRVIGTVTRAQMRAQNLLHRNVAVLCTNSDGHIYVQQRTETKDVYPGLYDMFVAGVVSAGESYDEAARREIGEELGIVGPTPMPLVDHRYEGEGSRSITRVYRVTWDGPMQHQPSEVAWGRYCTPQELIDNPRGWEFVPDGAEIFSAHRALLLHR
ncbi:MAG: NUDIX domain-containing protein [Myxococcales bacterium]|jgi:isopentenyldiphosphate isomerase